MDNKDPISNVIRLVSYLLTASVGIFNMLENMYPTLDAYKQCMVEFNLYTCNPCACWKPIKSASSFRILFESVVYDSNRIHTVLPMIFVAMSLVLTTMQKTTELFEMFWICNWLNFFMCYLALMDIYYCRVEGKKVIVYNYFSKDFGLQVGFMVCMVCILKQFVPRLQDIQNDEKRMYYRKKFLFKRHPIVIIWVIILAISMYGMYKYDIDNDDNFYWRCGFLIAYYLSIFRIRYSIFYILYNNVNSDYIYTLRTTSLFISIGHNSTSNFYVCHVNDCTDMLLLNVFSFTMGARYIIAIDDSPTIKAVYFMYWNSASAMQQYTFETYKKMISAELKSDPATGINEVVVNWFDKDPANQMWYYPCKTVDDDEITYYKARIIRLSRPNPDFTIVNMRHRNTTFQQHDVEVYLSAHFMLPNDPDWNKVQQYSVL